MTCKNICFTQCDFESPHSLSHSPPSSSLLPACCCFTQTPQTLAPVLTSPSNHDDQHDSSSYALLPLRMSPSASATTAAAAVSLLSDSHEHDIREGCSEGCMCYCERSPADSARVSLPCTSSSSSSSPPFPSLLSSRRIRSSIESPASLSLTAVDSCHTVLRGMPVKDRNANFVNRNHISSSFLPNLLYKLFSLMIID